MTIKRRIGVLVPLVLALLAWTLALASPASAKTEPPDLDDPQEVEELVRNVESAEDPYAAYAQLTPEEKAAFDRHLKVASVETGSESTSAANAASSASGCGSNSYYVKGLNVLGHTLWKFSTQTTWCWNGTEITNDPHFTTDGDVYYPFWSYHGTTYERETGGQGEWSHQDSAEGEFKYCIGPWGIGCIQSKYPDIHKTQYGDGEKTATGNQ